MPAPARGSCRRLETTSRTAWLRAGTGCGCSRVNAVGASPGAVTRLVDVGSAPTLPAVTATSEAHGFTVEWNAAAGTTFELRHRREGTVSWTEHSVGCGGTKCTFRTSRGSVQTGVGYEVELWAQNAFGTLDWTRVRSVKAGTAPGAPSSVTAADARAADGIDVAWRPPADPGSGVSGYWVEWTAQFTGEQQSQQVASGDRSFKIAVAVLKKGTDYYVRVGAVNAAGEEFSLAVDARATTAPGVVTDVELAPDDAQLVVNWAAPTDTGGSDVTGYGVRWKRSNQSGYPSANSHSVTGAGTTHTIPGLVNGTDYDVQVQAVNSARGGGAWSGASTAAPSQTVRKPTNVSVTAQPRALQVRWDAPTTQADLSGYLVSWVPAPGQFYTAAKQSTTLTDPAAVSTTISGLVATVEYQVTVQAEFSSGPAGSAAAVSGTPTRMDPAVDAPVGFGFLLSDAARTAAESRPSDPVAVDVSWTEPDVADGVVLTELQWKLASEQVWTDPLSVSQNPQTVEEFVLGKEYDLRLRHWNNDGPGAWAEPDGLLIAFRPDAPVLGSVTAGNASLEVSWTAPGFTGGSDITGFVVQWKSDTGTGDFADNSHIAAASDTAATIGSMVPLVNGTPYSVRVLARNAVEDSDPSAVRAGTTPADVPSAPQNVTVAGGHQSLIVSWGAPYSHGGSAVTGYEVRHRVGADGGWGAPVSVPGASRTMRTIASLSNGTEYWVEVLAVNGSNVNGGRGPGRGPWSPATPGTAATVPSEPRNVSATSGDASLALEWATPASDGGSPVTGYAVQYRAGTSGDWGAANVTVSDASASISGLVNGTRYQVQVRAENSSTVDDGEGPWSAAVSATPATVPSAPRNISTTSRDAGLAVTWDPPASDGGSPVTGYGVQYRAGSGAWRTANVNVSGASASISGLDNGTSYQVQVRAENSSTVDDGEGPWSTAVSGTPATVPGKPTILAVTPGRRLLTVTWAPPASNGGSRVTGYEVQYRSGGSWSTSNVTVSGLSAEITGLSENSSYVVQVRAVNGSNVNSGIGDWSDDSDSATPDPPDPPGAPANVRLERSGANLEATWDEPIDDGGDPVDHYEVAWRSTTEGYNDFYDETDRMTTSTSTTATISNLSGPPGNDSEPPEFEARVRAVNAGGESLWSSPFTATTASVPGPPRITGIELSADTLTVTWDPAESRGSTITNYAVQYRRKQYQNLPWSNHNTKTHSTSGPTTTFTTALTTTESGWQVRVAAESDLGRGEWSNSKSKAFVPLPSPPTSLSAIGTHGRVTVQWALDTDDKSSKTLRWRAVGATDADWTEVDFDMNYRTARNYHTAHTVTGLTNGTSYEFQMAATNDTGTSEWTSSVTATPQENLQTVSDLRVPQEQYNKIFVRWDEGLHLTLTDITGFVLRWRYTTDTSFPSDNTVEISGSDSHKHTVRNVDPGKSYIIEVRAVSNSDEYGAAVVATTTLTPKTIMYERFLPEHEDTNPWIRTVLDARNVPVGTTGSGGLHGMIVTSPNGWSGNQTVEFKFSPGILNSYRGSTTFFHELGHSITLDHATRDDTRYMAILWLYLRSILQGEGSAIV